MQNMQKSLMHFEACQEKLVSHVCNFIEKEKEKKREEDDKLS
jgi:hypothetical protein